MTLEEQRLLQEREGKEIGQKTGVVFKAEERSEIVKFTPKNYIEGCRIWEDLFLTRNIIFARSVSFTTPSVP